MCIACTRQKDQLQTTYLEGRNCATARLGPLANTRRRKMRIIKLVHGMILSCSLSRLWLLSVICLDNVNKQLLKPTLVHFEKSPVYGNQCHMSHERIHACKVFKCETRSETGNINIIKKDDTVHHISMGHMPACA
jgi:hypothetical protein